MRCLKVFIPNILAELFQSEGTRGGDGNPPPPTPPTLFAEIGKKIMQVKSLPRHSVCFPRHCNP